MTGTSARDAAWHALHDPATDASALARIAQAHPEFADAVARHPNCYPELREWARAQAAAVGTVPAEAAASAPVVPEGAAAPRAPHPRTMLIAGGVAGALILAGGGAVWAWSALSSGADPAPAPPASAEAAPAPIPAPASTRTLPGDPVYIGDELDWFLLDDSEILGFFPDAQGISTDAVYFTVGEGEGIHTEPEACFPWAMDLTNAVVGTRVTRWQTANDDHGWVQVLQMANVAKAQAFYREIADGVATCGSYEVRQYPDEHVGDGIVELLAGDPAGTVLVTQHLSSTVYTPDTYTSFRAFAVEGNVVLKVIAPAGERAVDADALASLLEEILADARARLTDEIGYR